MPLFVKKMKHKGLLYTGPQQLIEEPSIKKVRKAWQSSIAHQINFNDVDSPDVMINEVIRRIEDNLSN